MKCSLVLYCSKSLHLLHFSDNSLLHKDNKGGFYKCQLYVFLDKSSWQYYILFTADCKVEPHLLTTLLLQSFDCPKEECFSVIFSYQEPCLYDHTFNTTTISWPSGGHITMFHCTCMCMNTTWCRKVFFEQFYIKLFPFCTAECPKTRVLQADFGIPWQVLFVKLCTQTSHACWQVPLSKTWHTSSYCKQGDLQLKGKTCHNLLLYMYTWANKICHTKTCQGKCAYV